MYYTHEDLIKSLLTDLKRLIKDNDHTIYEASVKMNVSERYLANTLAMRNSVSVKKILELYVLYDCKIAIDYTIES